MALKWRCPGRTIPPNLLVSEEFIFNRIELVLRPAGGRARPAGWGAEVGRSSFFVARTGTSSLSGLRSITMCYDLRTRSGFELRCSPTASQAGGAGSPGGSGPIVS